MRRSLLLAAALASWSCRKDDKVAAEMEKRCTDAVADGQVTEARAWLDAAQTTHMGFEVGKDEMRELTEALYAAGAVQVRAAWSTLGDMQVSSLLVVDLPAEGRAPLFGYYDQIRARYELEDVRDAGQSCLLFGLD